MKYNYMAGVCVLVVYHMMIGEEKKGPTKKYTSSKMVITLDGILSKE